MHLKRRRADMFATLFHEVGFNFTVLESFVIRQGPISWNSPIMLELPGCSMLTSAGHHARREEATHAAIKPDSQRRGVRVRASGKEPEPRARDGGEQERWGYPTPGTDQMLWVDVRSPYPDAWYTPGVVSRSRRTA